MGTVICRTNHNSSWLDLYSIRISFSIRYLLIYYLHHNHDTNLLFTLPQLLYGEDTCPTPLMLVLALSRGQVDASVNQFVIFELIIDLAAAKIWIPFNPRFIVCFTWCVFLGKLSSCTCILTLQGGAGWFLECSNSVGAIYVITLVNL